MMLGLDSYSLRWQGWDAFRLMDYAASLGLQNVQFSERSHLESLDSDYLQSVRTRAVELGLRIEVGMRSFNRHSSTFDPELGTGSEQLSAMLHAAETVGSEVVRCFLGVNSDRLSGQQFGAHIEEAIRTLREVAPLAERLGVSIAMENHGAGDLLAPELRDIMEAVGSHRVGVCLDTGNPVFAAEDPVHAAEILAPYVVTTHIRDSRVWCTDEGAMVQWVPAGAGDIDLQRIVLIMQRHAPNVSINLEVITGDPPRAISLFDDESELWQMYPDMKAQSLAKFIKLAQKGAPVPFDQQCLLGTHLSSLSEDRLDTFRNQQRQHVEQSVKFCREALGI